MLRLTPVKVWMTPQQTVCMFEAPWKLFRLDFTDFTVSGNSFADDSGINETSHSLLWMLHLFLVLMFLLNEPLCFSSFVKEDCTCLQ